MAFAAAVAKVAAVAAHSAATTAARESTHRTNAGHATTAMNLSANTPLRRYRFRVRYIAAFFGEPLD